jgi:carboxylesterase type B
MILSPNPPYRLTFSVLVNSGRRLNQTQAAEFQDKMFKAYPNDPAVGCPYDGKNTTYGQTSQYKRMASIMTDSMYTEAWTEYLDIFSPSKVWGIMFDEPIPGTDPAFGVQHGSDLIFYFPTLFGSDGDPRTMGMGKLVDTIHESITHFVNDLAPTSSGYDWPMYADTKKVTQLSAQGPAAIDPPYRPGFPVLREYLRPNGFDE